MSTESSESENRRERPLTKRERHSEHLNVRPSERRWLGLGAREHWLLDPEYTFLNHGSFGASPRVVLDAQSEWRLRMETHPVHFHLDEGPAAIRETAQTLGAFLGTAGENIVFVENATTAINAVLRSFPWRAGDEIVYTNHGYGAINNAVRYAAERYSVKAVEARVPFPVNGADEIVAVVEAALTSRTRLAVLDHVTSTTAVVFPIERLIALCHDRDIQVLVDGAHAPGMLPLNLDALEADYYTGNCHKWLFAPKGCGFLFARPDRQSELHPTVISWGLGEGFVREFDWTGTKDCTAWLSLATAIEFFHRVDPKRRREYNNALAERAGEMLAEAWNVDVTAPPSMRAHMVTLQVPMDIPATKEALVALHNRLYDEHKIEVPLFEHEHRLWIRVSAQAYNVEEDYERLARAILDERTR